MGRPFKTGRPLKEDTQIGPLARLICATSCTVRSSEHCRGVRAACSGGAIPNDPGALLSLPRVDRCASGDCRLMKGAVRPVASHHLVKDEEEADRDRQRFGVGLGVASSRATWRAAAYPLRRIERRLRLVNEAVATPTRDPLRGVNRESGYETRALRLRNQRSL